MNQPQLGTYDLIALDAIRPSPTNPRKNFNPAALEELAGSIREVGVTVPILVRPWPKQVPLDPPSATVSFEIVSGERRWKAAQAAGLTEIPAFFRKLTDAEAADLQLIENLQRADLHPVEEAEGYRALCAGGASVEDVAKKVGKTTAYVQQRLKLLTLELPAKLLFHAGHLTLGHALMLARLTTKDQDRAVRNLLGANHLPAKEDMVAFVTKQIEYHKDKNFRMVRDTEGALREWISTHVMLSLAKVPWSLEDPLLVPEAGACTTCPKRTGTNAALFADLTVDEDVCLDASCFATKQKAIQAVKIQAAAEAGAPLVKLSAKNGHQPIVEPADEKAAAKLVVKQGQWVKAKPGSCPSVRKGMLTDEPGRYDQLKAKPGDVLHVCTDQKCKVHQHTVDKPSPAGGGSQYNQSYAADQKARDAYVAAERPIRAAIVQAIEDNAEPGLLEIRSGVFELVRNYARVARVLGLEFEDDVKSEFNANEEAEPVVKHYLETATVAQLGMVVLIDQLARELIPYSYGRQKEARAKLWKLAEHYGVDADAIAARVEAERAPKPEPAQPAKPAAAAAKTAKKKKLDAAAQKKRKAAAAKQAFSSAVKKTIHKLHSAKPDALAERPAADFRKGVRGKYASSASTSVPVIDGKSRGAGERLEEAVR